MPRKYKRWEQNFFFYETSSYAIKIQKKKLKLFNKSHVIKIALQTKNGSAVPIKSVDTRVHSKKN